MSANEIKAIYDSLVESDELQTFHPELTGCWETDRLRFTSLYNATENLIEGLDDDDDDFLMDFEFSENF